MLIAHLADLHLGYRAYHRLAPGGVNQRERDVSEALGRALAQVVAARPDLVLVAGDVFHTVRPSNSAIMDGFRHFMRLRRSLPDTPVVMIAGNHDSPRSADTGSILRLLGEIPDIHVVDDGARTVVLESLSTSVLCLPHAALVGAEPPSLEPDPAAAVNVLMLHGTVSGTGVDEQLLKLVEYGGAHIDRGALREEVWDYIALGHYHNATRVASNLWYAGAVERTATNIWAEADTRKGWVLYDTEAREGEFRDVATREVVDLPRFSARRSGAPGGARSGAPGWPDSSGDDGRPGGAAEAGGTEGTAGVDAGGTAGGDAGAGDGDRRVREGRPADRAAEDWLTAGEIDERIRAAVSGLPGGVGGKVVRLVITEIPRELFRQLDHRQIRALKAEALHFQLDARRPEVRQRRVEDEDARRRTLEEELEQFLSEWEPTTPGIDRDRLVTLGAAYLAATEDWREAELELFAEQPAAPGPHDATGEPESARGAGNGEDAGGGE